MLKTYARLTKKWTNIIIFCCSCLQNRPLPLYLHVLPAFVIWSYLPDLMPIIRSLFCKIRSDVSSSIAALNDFISGQKSMKSSWERQGNMKTFRSLSLVLPILCYLSVDSELNAAPWFKYGKLFSSIVLMSIHVMLPMFIACCASYAQCAVYIRVSNIHIDVWMCVDVHLMFRLCANFAFSGLVWPLMSMHEQCWGSYAVKLLVI